MLAGLGVAVPLGAIGVLVVRQGALSGFRSGAAAGSAVAMVDTAYCVSALAAGGLIAEWFAATGGTPTVVAASVLIGLGAWGILRSRRERSGVGSPRTAPSHPRTFALFALMTAVNPVTLIYFTTVATAVPRGEIAAATMYVLGVSSGSLMWQLVLAGAGFRLGSRISHRSQRVVDVVGYGIVVTLGFTMLWR